MGKTKHVELPFWTEYISNNMEETNIFLQEMFGWKVFSKTENDVYLMFNETPIMNVSQRDKEMEKEGIPPHIRNYITVADYDKSLSLALKKGAKLIHEAEVNTTYNHIKRLTLDTGTDAHFGYIRCMVRWSRRCCYCCSRRRRYCRKSRFFWGAYNPNVINFYISICIYDKVGNLRNL